MDELYSFFDGLYREEQLTIDINDSRYNITIPNELKVDNAGLRSNKNVEYSMVAFKIGRIRGQSEQGGFRISEHIS